VSHTHTRASKRPRTAPAYRSESSSRLLYDRRMSRCITILRGTSPPPGGTNAILTRLVVRGLVYSRIRARERSSKRTKPLRKLVGSMWVLVSLALPLIDHHHRRRSPSLARGSFTRYVCLCRRARDGSFVISLTRVGRLVGWLVGWRCDSYYGLCTLGGWWAAFVGEDLAASLGACLPYVACLACWRRCIEHGTSDEDTHAHI